MKNGQRPSSVEFPFLGAGGAIRHEAARRIRVNLLQRFEHLDPELPAGQAEIDQEKIDPLAMVLEDLQDLVGARGKPDIEARLLEGDVKGLAKLFVFVGNEEHRFMRLGHRLG